MLCSHVSEFCELFRQHYDNVTLKVNASDVSTQTDLDLETVGNTVDGPKQATSNPKMNTGKKRGRKKKVVTEDDGQENNISTEENKEKESGGCGADEGVCYAVSRRGRIIKPKHFYNDVIPWLKHEKDSDPRSDLSVKTELDVSEDNLGENKPETLEDHDDSDISDPTYKAPKTDSATGTISTKSTKLPTISQYVCGQCDFVAEKLTAFNEHELLHSYKVRKCPFCDQFSESSFETFEDFKSHVKTHESPEVFLCYFCQASFNTKAKLHQHLQKHSKIKPYVCEVCNMGFKWKHALKTHLVVHSESKNFLCDLCGYATVHRMQLKAHYLIHSGDTFKCQEPNCDYQATKRSNLKVHMMSHTKEKPHLCVVCGTRFSLVKNLKRHMLLHASDRPFACELCNFSSTRFDKLKEHYFKAHNVGEKPAKKMRLTDYIKLQESEELLSENNNENIVSNELAMDGIETIELQISDDMLKVEGATQIVNVTSSTGETVPIAITNDGTHISYEVKSFPLQIAMQEEVAM